MDFLTCKWEKELKYKLKKEYWAHKIIALPSGSNMNIRQVRGTGLELMEAKTGSLVKMD